MPDVPSTPATPDLERKLLTILSADVAEYSRLMAEDEEQTLRVFRDHKHVFESLVALHRGRIFNTAGDAILAEFASAVEAVRCATEIQAALRTRNDQLPRPRQVCFRMGVNLGDVMVQGTDLMGDGVNVAARLQSAAEPGGICVSGSVYDQIRNKLSLSFKSMGEQTYKNIPHPVRTFSIAEAEGLGALPSRKEARGAPRGALKWIAAAALALVLAGGYWVFADNERGRAEQARILDETTKRESGRRAESERLAAEAVRREAQLVAERAAAEEALKRAEAERQRLEAERRAADRAAAEEAAKKAVAERQKLEAETRAAELARQQAETERKRAEEATRRADDERRKAEAARQAAAVPAPAPENRPPAAAIIDGKYAGPICLGPAPTEDARCFRAQAAVSGGKINGEWPGAEGRTNTVLGAVTETGQVMMRWLVRRPDGTIYGMADLEGTLRDGRLEAAGKFGSGRTANFQWRRE